MTKNDRNDVVDIFQSRLESVWRRSGFLQKNFTDDEQQYIIDATDPEILVWLLWSMKEAAYKIYNRQAGIRSYIPKKLECKILFKGSADYTGLVVCYNNLFYTSTVIIGDSLHTVAVRFLSDLEKIVEVDKKFIIKKVMVFLTCTIVLEIYIRTLKLATAGGMKK